MRFPHHCPPHSSPPAEVTWPPAHRDLGPSARLPQLDWTPGDPRRHDITGPYVLAPCSPCPHRTGRAAAAPGPSRPREQAASIAVGDPKGPVPPLPVLIRVQLSANPGPHSPLIESQILPMQNRDDSSPPFTKQLQAKYWAYTYPPGRYCWQFTFCAISGH